MTHCLYMITNCLLLLPIFNIIILHMYCYNLSIFRKFSHYYVTQNSDYVTQNSEYVTQNTSIMLHKQFYNL
jgi:hypothetical protein